MENYLKEFNTHSEYETFKASTDFIRPNVSICNQEDDVHYNGHDYSEDYLTFKALEGGTFSFSDNNIDYSLDDGKTWTTLTASQNTPLIKTGEKIMWKANGFTPTGAVGIGTFSSTGKFEVEGNAMSLLYGDNFENQTDLTGKDYAFKFLFIECTNLISALKLILPATTLSSECYSNMFNGCTSLTTAPELPAESLGSECYYGMFNNCSSLINIQEELPATTLASYCYYNMFKGCSSLTTAPALPATTLANSCYAYMFQNCTALISAPELPATTLAGSCYQYMFNRCTSLTTAPALSATTLASRCYYGMFGGCTSLTTAPELPATTLAESCYQAMFKDCSNLNYVKAMFTTTPGATYTSGWLSGVAATGTFVKNSIATWTTTGANGVPTGWTVQTASA